MIIHFTTIDTPIGKCTLGAINKAICWVSLNDDNTRFLSFVNSSKSGIKAEEDPSQFNTVLPILENYFNGKRVNFSEIKTIYITGTPFQQSIWDALKLIDYGKTISYGELAKSIGKPGAFRAAGTANGKNLIPLIIPCHRVIKSDGTLGGYSGGLDIKAKLLKIEGIKLN